MSEKVSKRAVFVWDEQKLKVAEAIAKGDRSVKETLTSCGITERIYYKWKKHPAFELKLSEIIADIDISQKAERIKIAKKVIRAKMAEEDHPEYWTKKDLLDWLKYVGEETGDYEPALKIKHEISLNEKIKKYEELFSGK